MEINGNLLSDEFYKFNEQNDIVELNDGDYKKIIDYKNTIKIQFPYGINGIISDIQEYSIDYFNIGKLINIIKEFYNSNLSEKEKEKIYTQSGVNIDNLYIRKDILTYTNQYFLEEIEYKNDVYILRIGS